MKNQNVGAVATLLEAGADANVANKRGVMPISAAAHKGNTIVMRSLITAGANVNALNSSGSTALIQVCFGQQQFAAPPPLPRTHISKTVTCY